MSRLKRSYWKHPCKVGRRKFESITAAALYLGISRSYLAKLLRDGRPGYELLPFDGVLPSGNNLVPQAPHVHVEGNWYYSQTEAAEAVGVSQAAISRRIHDPQYPRYYVHLVS